MDMKPVVVLLLLAGLAGATIINVVVSDRIRYVVDYIETRDSTYWEFVGNVENTGSVTCPAQMKLETQDGKFWTEKVILDPGQIYLFRIPYITNESEQGNVTMYFCDRADLIGSYNISPTTLVPGNVSAKAVIRGKTVEIEGSNITMIPLAPKNLVLPIQRVNGRRVVEYNYPGNFTGELKFLVFNNTSYNIIEAGRAADMEWARKLSEILIYVLAGMVAGRLLNGL